MPVPDVTPDPVDPAPILGTAGVFAAAWLTPGSTEERKAALKDVTAPGFLVSVADIPADNLPAGPPGDVTLIEASEGWAAVNVALPAGAARIELSETAAGWRVISVDKG